MKRLRHFSTITDNVDELRVGKHFRERSDMLEVHWRLLPPSLLAFTRCQFVKNRMYHAPKTGLIQLKVCKHKWRLTIYLPEGFRSPNVIRQPVACINSAQIAVTVQVVYKKREHLCLHRKHVQIRVLP